MKHPQRRRRTLLTAVCVAAVAGCAGGGGGDVEDMGMGAIEMQFWNRSDETMVVFARWGTAPRVRLGQISGGRRATYQTAVRGPRVAISWDIVSATPPPGTGVGFFPRVADAPTDPQCGVDVVPGDRVEWTIEVNARACSYLRLDPAA